MHYYPFNLKDYLAETAHLPPMADLAYRRLLDLYYKTEAPIRNEPKWVANRIRMDTEEQAIEFVLKEYFILDVAQNTSECSIWRHKTCDEVIAKYQKKVAVARANGEKHTVGTKKEPKSDADRLLTKNQEPRTNLSRRFADFWSKYPRKVGKAAAEKAFIKTGADDALLASMLDAVGRQGLAGRVAAGEGQFVPHPATWLTEHRWLDEEEAPASNVRRLVL